ncbi:hypothetical protein B0H66DRAFT_592393 [Apodospora peruviana]|uniref:Uncharacterized protein n=1 Tax=Apodospora peruviana TaxID=516989 RepID=A0AAE0M293_9PEZI|nr:hypothetical protein B0H66DRAFT_592393 [Apodospora peruviana]
MPSSVNPKSRSAPSQGVKRPAAQSTGPAKRAKLATIDSDDQVAIAHDDNADYSAPMGENNDDEAEYFPDMGEQDDADEVHYFDLGDADENSNDKIANYTFDVEVLLPYVDVSDANVGRFEARLKAVVEDLCKYCSENSFHAR